MSDYDQSSKQQIPVTLTGPINRTE